MPIIEVVDWNLEYRYYEMEEDKIHSMMKLRRDDRTDFFAKNAEPTAVHHDGETDLWFPIFTSPEDWQMREKEYREYFGVKRRHIRVR